MPRVVRFHELGGPEVLRIEEMPAQQPGRGEVRLRVQTVGLNRAESMFLPRSVPGTSPFPFPAGL